MTTLAERLHRLVRHGRSPEAVSRDTVVLAYQRLLGRDPESEAVIAQAMRFASPLALFEAILGSAEFQARGGHRMDHCAAPLDVDWRVEPDVAAAFLARIAETWRLLGEERPYWSVLAGPEYLPENMAGQQQRFYDSGADDLQILLTTLARIGRAPAEFPVVFE